jgi:hypothetical protein
MVSSAATTVADYLASLPTDRRRELERVRAVILRHLPSGYEESMASGMIAYSVPLRAYPDTYNGQPLMYAALASQKNHLSLYLMSVYGSPLEQRLRAGFAEAGKKLDLGKTCVRFRSADDLALDTVGEIVAGTPADEFVAAARAARRR